MARSRLWARAHSPGHCSVSQAELFMDKLPITSSNFADLAKTGFYDGLTFHRVINVRSAGSPVP